MNFNIWFSPITVYFIYDRRLESSTLHLITDPGCFYRCRIRDFEHLYKLSPTPTITLTPTEILTL